MVICKVSYRCLQLKYAFNFSPNIIAVGFSLK